MSRQPLSTPLRAPADLARDRHEPTSQIRPSGKPRRAGPDVVSVRPTIILGAAQAWQRGLPRVDDSAAVSPLLAARLRLLLEEPLTRPLGSLQIPHVIATAAGGRRAPDPWPSADAETPTLRLARRGQRPAASQLAAAAARHAASEDPTAPRGVRAVSRDALPGSRVPGASRAHAPTRGIPSPPQRTVTAERFGRGQAGRGTMPATAAPPPWRASAVQRAPWLPDARPAARSGRTTASACLRSPQPATWAWPVSLAVSSLCLAYAITTSVVSRAEQPPPLARPAAAITAYQAAAPPTYAAQLEPQASCAAGPPLPGAMQRHSGR